MTSLIFVLALTQCRSEHLCMQYVQKCSLELLKTKKFLDNKYIDEKSRAKVVVSICEKRFQDTMIYE